MYVAPKCPVDDPFKYHKIFEATVPLLFKVANAPPHNASGPAGVTAGAAGVFKIVTTNEALLGLLPQLLVSQA